MNERAYWNKRKGSHYRMMARRHPALWRFVREYIEEREICRVLEVGGGLESKAREWVPHYQGIDLNEKTDAIHEDFVTMDVTPFQGVDLLLACAVIEHCPEGYEPFLEQVRRLKPKHAVVSFFNTLRWSANSVMQSEDGYWLNVYSGEELTRWLDESGFNFTIRRLSKNDSVLII